MSDSGSTAFDPGRPPTATSAGVLRPDQFAKHVSLDRADCSPDLSPWVENYWSLRWDLPAGTSYVSSTLPHPACNLSVERGNLREAVGPDPVVVTGVVTRRFDVTIRGAGWVYAAKFRPGGLAALTGVNARSLRDTTVAARTVFDPATADALRTLGPEDSSEACRDQFTEVLTRLATTPDDDYRLLLDVIALMLDDRSLLRVNQVEEHCGVGTRTLQRLFERYVGVSPKWVLSRYRMHDVVTDLDAGYGGSLADLAAKYGWFDQAHFTREFTELIGVPPGVYQQQTPPH
ncbi:MAG: helix-turn-helix transcriptional regulator [Marmoricola sp.]